MKARSCPCAAVCMSSAEAMTRQQRWIEPVRGRCRMPDSFRRRREPPERSTRAASSSGLYPPPHRSPCHRSCVAGQDGSGVSTCIARPHRAATSTHAAAGASGLTVVSQVWAYDTAGPIGCGDLWLPDWWTFLEVDGALKYDECVVRQTRCLSRSAGRSAWRGRGSVSLASRAMNYANTRRAAGAGTTSRRSWRHCMRDRVRRRVRRTASAVGSPGNVRRGGSSAVSSAAMKGVVPALRSRDRFLGRYARRTAAFGA